MLTDLFSYRYADRPIWQDFKQTDTLFVTQAFRLVAEELFPAQRNGKSDLKSGEGWKAVQSKLSMELGVDSLSPLNAQGADGRWFALPMDYVCKVWMFAPANGRTADEHMKNRVSFVEVAFRERMQQIDAANKSHEAIYRPALAKTNQPGYEALRVLLQSNAEMARAENQFINKQFSAACDELNERMRRAKLPLTYHNGYIQIATDEQMDQKVGKPFWALLTDAKWKNVEIDMAEAVDRQESAQRDPAFYAAKALESVLKIISDEKGWSTGKERSASNYIDNLRSAKNGSLIVEWEAEALRHYFSKVRNELGHGPGGEPMPALTQQQTDWAIETAMSWAKSLISRM